MGMREMKRGAEFDAAMAELIAQVAAQNTPAKRDAERFAIARNKRRYAALCAQRDAEVMSHKTGQDVGVIHDGKISHSAPDSVVDFSEPASSPLYGGI